MQLSHLLINEICKCEKIEKKKMNKFHKEFPYSWEMDAKSSFRSLIGSRLISFSE